jgi:hypothetical protein
MPLPTEEFVDLKAKVNEIHEALVGTTARTGLVGRVEKNELRARKHEHLLGAAFLGILGAAADIIIRRFGA